MAVAQGEATDDRGTLVATATSTHAILHKVFPPAGKP
jgi:acyl-coenzyme A thioesterase PaaI-like protein